MPRIGEDLELRSRDARVHVLHHGQGNERALGRSQQERRRANRAELRGEIGADEQIGEIQHRVAVRLRLNALEPAVLRLGDAIAVEAERRHHLGPRLHALRADERAPFPRALDRAAAMRGVRHGDAEQRVGLTDGEVQRHGAAERLPDQVEALGARGAAHRAHVVGEPVEGPAKAGSGHRGAAEAERVEPCDAVTADERRQPAGPQVGGGADAVVEDDEGRVRDPRRREVGDLEVECATRSGESPARHRVPRHPVSWVTRVTIL